LRVDRDRPHEEEQADADAHENADDEHERVEELLIVLAQRRAPEPLTGRDYSRRPRRIEAGSRVAAARSAAAALGGGCSASLARLPRWQRPSGRAAMNALHWSATTNANIVAHPRDSSLL
jgi:hypothetical protein